MAWGNTRTLVDAYGRPLSVVNRNPQVQIGERRMRRPNVAEVLAEFNHHEIVDAVLESFRFQAKIQGRRSTQGIFTPGELRRRWRMFLPFLLECRFDCGHSKSEAVKVAGARLIDELFGVPSEIPVYAGNRRTDSGASAVNPNRSMRSARARVSTAEVDDWTAAERTAAERSL